MPFQGEILELKLKISLRYQGFCKKGVFMVIYAYIYIEREGSKSINFEKRKIIGIWNVQESKNQKNILSYKQIMSYQMVNLP